MDALKSIFSWLGKFLEKTRVVLLNVATAFILIVITVAILGGIFSGDAEIDKEGKVVFLDPAVVITDEEAFADSLFANTDINQMTFRDFEDLINELADDEEIAAIVIDFSSTGFAGVTTLLNVAGLMEKLQASDIELIAYSDYFDTSTYLLASYADEIWGHSSGSFGLRGPGGYQFYLNELLTKNLKFTIHDFSEGTFKSAGETITRSSMSDFERKQTQELLNPIWTEMKSLIAKQRAMSIDDVQDFADNHPTGFLGEANYINLNAATEIGFIDGVKSYPEFREHMIEKFGLDADSDRETYPNISYLEYMDTYEIAEDSADDKVAVVTVEGTITRGEIQPGIAGADGLARQLRSAHEDEYVKALVVRVNSGGGGVMASEIIRDEIQRAKSKGINVVVSMGDVAASGGVWIATPAEYIFAEPTTITGSIGVAIAFPTFENTMDEIGIDFDGVVTIVGKLFEVIKPQFAVFGLKDYQQFLIIKDLASLSDFETEIIGSAIVREKDGLAMSSRNNLLTSDDRLLAPEIYKRLCWIKENISKKPNEILIKESIDFFKTKGLVPEYLKICDAENLEDLNHFSGRALIAIAIKLGDVRLIDNILLD